MSRSKSHLKPVTISCLLHTGTWRKLYSLRMSRQSWCSPSGSPCRRWASPWDHCSSGCRYGNPSSCPHCPDLLFSGITYPLRVLVFWLHSWACARAAFECWTGFCMNLTHTKKLQVVSVPGDPELSPVLPGHYSGGFQVEAEVGHHSLLWHNRKEPCNWHRGCSASTTQNSFTSGTPNK